jgi:hypothetical protein
MIEQTLNELVETYNAKRLELADQIKLRLPEIYKDFFRKYPYLAAVRVKATTPSFNDGDVCEHNLHASFDMLEFSFKAQEVNGAEFYDLNEVENQALALEKRDTPHTTLNKAVIDFSANFGDCLYEGAEREGTLLALCDNLESLESILYDCYGTNVMITVSSDGNVEVKEFYSDY